ncbi:hypothetical protein [Ferrovibrio xuzhouensis]|uniref:Uncharacterized protein n=1 Tax=Ferrovibrio xuzhouensis TaxID=1576914 RepID=A0ABV7VA45_9PROT
MEELIPSANVEDHPRVAELKRSFHTGPVDFLETTTDLNDDDYALMGKLIQLYCFADLNARRIIDAIHHATLGADARSGSRLRDAEVFPRLQGLVNRWIPDSPLKEGLLKAARTVEIHRIHRHNFAHWAARKVKEGDAFILFTKNAREGERRDGTPQNSDEMKYAIVLLAPLKPEIEKLIGHCAYLANQAARFEHGFEEFKRAISVDGA